MQERAQRQCVHLSVCIQDFVPHDAFFLLVGRTVGLSLMYLFSAEGDDVNLSSVIGCWYINTISFDSLSLSVSCA